MCSSPNGKMSVQLQKESMYTCCMHAGVPDHQPHLGGEDAAAAAAHGHAAQRRRGSVRRRQHGCPQSVAQSSICAEPVPGFCRRCGADRAGRRVQRLLPRAAAIASAGAACRFRDACCHAQTFCTVLLLSCRAGHQLRYHGKSNVSLVCVALERARRWVPLSDGVFYCRWS